MKKNIFFLMLLAFYLQTNAQQNIGIGTSTPHSSSLLDVKSTNKGMLVPRINLISETDVVTIAAPATSLLVYNTNNTLTDGEGFYFWNGTKWSKLMNRANVSNLAWGITGNSGTNISTDFIGTTDNKALMFKTNNILSGKIDPGPNNVFFGQFAGVAITSGVNNTFIGHIAGVSDSSGSNNLFVGHFAGNANTSGSENVFVGQDAGRNNTTGNLNTFVGEDAGMENTIGDENVFIGNGAGRYNTNGYQNAALGNSALSNNTSGRYNAAFGHSALSNNIDGSGNAAFGFSALFSNIIGSNNAAFGLHALLNNINGTGNAAFGSFALSSNTSGGYNAAFGRSALLSNINGSENAAFGNLALFNNTTGSDNSSFGSSALQRNTTGTLNSAFGKNALINNTEGDYNTALGSATLTANTTGSGNAAFGDGALSFNTTGSHNTAIGQGSGPGVGFQNLFNTTSIGYSAVVSTVNTMVFGDADVHRWAFGLSTTNANHALEVGEIVGDGNGAYLTQGGTWANASDANKKEDFTTLNGTDLLQKITSLPITKWRYKGSEEYHIGPMAQDFYKLFGLGTDDKGISTVDPAGIALAAIQEQQKLIEKQQELILQLQKRIELLEKK